MHRNHIPSECLKKYVYFTFILRVSREIYRHYIPDERGSINTFIVIVSEEVHRHCIPVVCLVSNFLVYFNHSVFLETRQDNPSF